MIKIYSKKKLFCFGIVLCTFFLSQTSKIVFANSTFKLPSCPAENADSQPKEELPAIKMETKEVDKEAAVTDSGHKLQRKSGPKKVLSNFDKAQNINLVPLSLIPSKSEAEESRRQIYERHNSQLKDLWTATIERSPDIKFAISILQPNSNPKHASAEALKMVGIALFNVGGTIAPNGPAKTATQFGNPLLSSLFQQEKPAGISVGETLVLYKMVRDIADNVVNSYWSYRKAIAEYKAAAYDLAELERLREGVLDEAKASEISNIQYQVNRAKRDLNVCNENKESCEQHLLDLCGPEALAKLQTQIQEEEQALIEIVGRPDINEPLSPHDPTAAHANPKPSENDNNKLHQ